jgi:transketolase N-terminal domain/subunit
VYAAAPAIVVVENLAGNVGQHDFLRFGPNADDKLGVSASGGSLGWGVGAAADIAAALKRGTAETRGGRPYLLEIAVGRVGGGADSTWHQTFSAAALQTSQV